MTSIWQNFIEELKQATRLDDTDLSFAVRFAEKWKLSFADSLLDLHFVDETTLAQALANANHLKYITRTDLKCEFSGVDLETFDDLMSVGAVPLQDETLAICNPYDDIKGNLSRWLSERELVVTERSAVFDALRKFSLSDSL